MGDHRSPEPTIGYLSFYLSVSGRVAPSVTSLNNYVAGSLQIPRMLRAQ